MTERALAPTWARSIRVARRRFVRWWTPLKLVGLLILAFALCLWIAGSFYPLFVGETNLLRTLADIAINASAELTGIAITLLIVDELYQRRETDREKRRLILQMGSPDNAFAREAVRALQSHGWLRNGSVSKAHLKGANLQGANLWRANLQGACLEFANLQDAHLLGANLQGAKYNDNTVWPEGFTPPPRAVRVEE